MQLVLVDLQTMKSVAELPWSSVEATDGAQGVGELRAELSLTGLPEVIDLTTPWQSQIALLDDDQNPLWMGPITKRRGSAAGVGLEVVARQWEFYLDQVFLPDEYDHDGEDDAATIIYHRLADLRDFLSRQTGFSTLPLPDNVPAECGVTVPFSWRSGYSQDGDWQSEPQTVLSDITSITDQGFCFAFKPHQDQGQWSLELCVTIPSAEPTAALHVGDEIADVELFDNGEVQATRVFVVGEGSTFSIGEVSGHEPLQPLLMRSHSYLNVYSAETLDALAGALVTASAVPIVGTSDVTLTGAQQFLPGQLVELSVPAGLYAVWPLGAQWLMRVDSTTWSASQGASETLLTLTQPLEGGDVWLIPENNLSKLVGTLSKRLANAEVRRGVKGEPGRSVEVFDDANTPINPAKGDLWIRS